MVPLLVLPTSSTLCRTSTGGPVAIVFGSGKVSSQPLHHRPLCSGHLQGHPEPDRHLWTALRKLWPACQHLQVPSLHGYSDADILSTAKVNQDNNNFGPTVGFAYSPRLNRNGIGNGTTVIRGGYQVTYDVFYNNLLSNMAAASPNALANTPAPSNSTATTPRGLANLSALLPSLVPVPLTPYSNEQSNFSKNIRNPYYHHFSLGVQQQFPANMVLDVAYVGSLGRQLLYTNPLNPALPNPTFTGTYTQPTPLRSDGALCRKPRTSPDPRLGVDFQL